MISDHRRVPRGSINIFAGFDDNIIIYFKRAFLICFIFHLWIISSIIMGWQGSYNVFLDPRSRLGKSFDFIPVAILLYILPSCRCCWPKKILWFPWKMHYNINFIYLYTNIQYIMNYSL